jgi:hypothetical protein
MADSTIAVTAGSGTPMKTSQVDSSTNHVQYVRELQADTAATPGSYTLSATATTSAIAADAARTGLLFVNNGSARVYIRFDTTAPTSTTNHWWLDPSERWEVPSAFCRLVVSLISSAGATGTLNWALGTKA